MNNNIALKVTGVSKTFNLPHEKAGSIKNAVVNVWRRSRRYEKQHVLKNVSFEIKKGEFFGIVGRNGSGKSTLLKTIAGIYSPDKGNVEINGKLVPFIELGVGFNPELTGRDNVYLNGALLGFNRKEMEAMYHDIVAFAELERFMDQKLKNYSSGMQVRLAFSIAIRARGDILLLDEVLAVGDAAFQQKCYDYFNALKQQNRTIILVSHSMQIVEQFCDRALLLESGKVKEIGSSNHIASLYEDMFLREEVERIKEDRRQIDFLNTSSDGIESEPLLEVLDVRVLQKGAEADRINAGHSFEVQVKIRSNKELSNINTGINIKNRDRVMVISTDTKVTLGSMGIAAGQERTFSFVIENQLTNGIYTISVGIAEGDTAPQKVRARKENVKEFIIEGVKYHSKALVHPVIKTKEL